VAVKIKRLLEQSKVEKDVENAYRAAILASKPQAEVTSPHGTDGYAKWATGAASVRLLLEAKYDLDFKSRLPICNTLGQCLLYLKRFEQAGEGPLPNVLLVGDKNECFVLSTAAVKGFLDLPLDWSVAPSKGDPMLTRALVEGLNILPYVYDVDGNFDFNEVIAKVEVLAEGSQHTIKANPTNIGAIFIYWRDRVFQDSALTAVEQVDVYLRCLFQPSDVYLHPSKLGVLVVPGYPEGVRVNPEQYRSFFNHFEQGYKPSEIEAFYAGKDRLVEDDARRRQGAFFTPDLWVAEAHKSLEKVLGVNWKDECIVWDPACGTGNLTRDYTFKDLILSTAERPDVEVIKGQGYNPGAATFQYDFLNPDGAISMFFEEGQRNEIPDAVHDRLKAAATGGKRLVFLMNPPYGTANNAGTKEGDSKAGIALTAVNADMARAKMGACRQQLYAQFLYQSSTLARDYGFKKHTVAAFSVPTFLASGSYKPFRDWWYSHYECKDAWLFQASHFSDVSGRWGISFTVWSEGETNSGSVVPFTLKDEQDFRVVAIGQKGVYNSDDRAASDWVREPTKGLKGEDAPQMSSGLRVKGVGVGAFVPGSLGYMLSNSNSIQHNQTVVGLFSGPCSAGHGLSVLPGESFRRAVALYAARKLVPETWVTQKDEYLVPTPASQPDYERWVDDCHIYALLHNGNNCTAMRDVSYGNRKWQIHNHFFWLTRDVALQLLDTPKTPTPYRDCKAHPSKDVFGKPVESSPDPYLASVLATGSLDLSQEAQDVLAQLDALWKASLPVREAYAAGKPELHLMAWDAGVYQLKHLWRDLFPSEWANLQTVFKRLAEKLKPGVYEHGFLIR